MIYPIIIVITGYLAVILCGYLIKFLLRKYEREIESSGLKGAGMVIVILRKNSNSNICDA